MKAAGKYIFAVAAVALAAVARVALVDPVLNGRIPFPVFFAALVASVWVGGVGPGLLAAILGYGVTFGLFLMSEDAPGSVSYHLVSAFSYLLVCASTIGMTIALRRAQERAELLAHEAHRKEALVAESERQKDKFIATLAHELRNPLAPIRSGLDLLRRRKGAPADVIERTYGVMDRQLGNLVRLVDDLMDASRFMHGKIKLCKRWVELEDVVGDAIEATRQSIEAAGVDFSVHLPETRTRIYVDPTRLAQVLANLLNNSAKFTPRGGHVELDAAIEGSGSNGDARLVLSVRDNGAGIDAALLARVFDPFVQAEPVGDKKSQGMGIGLYLVRTLVDLHGGTVEARSAGRGQGSEFAVRLPLALGAEEALAPTKPPVPSPHALQRLLVVDDNRDAATGLAEVLKSLGHEVQVAYDGPSALAIEASFEPDLLLLDLGLPEMDGYEVARRLREQTKRKKRPVLVAVTGWGQQEDRSRSRAAGFDAHLVKPLDIPVLERLLDTRFPTQVERLTSRPH
jgi:signal transduction histidine kinase/ActR/RegA family two-component response regulator